MRKIHLDGKIYQYRIGRGYVVIEFPNGNREVVSDSTITGRTNDALERGRWKKTSDGMVLPSHVKAWLEKRKRIVKVDGQYKIIEKKFKQEYDLLSPFERRVKSEKRKRSCN